MSHITHATRGLPVGAVTSADGQLGVWGVPAPAFPTRHAEPLPGRQLQDMMPWPWQGGGQQHEGHMLYHLALLIACFYMTRMLAPLEILLLLRCPC